MGNPSGVVVFLEVNELRLHARVSNTLVSQHLHYVQYIFGLMVLHCCFPMPERVKSALPEPLIFELARMFVPKLVCDVPDASGFGFIAIIYGCFSC